MNKKYTHAETKERNKKGSIVRMVFRIREMVSCISIGKVYPLCSYASVMEAKFRKVDPNKKSTGCTPAFLAKKTVKQERTATPVKTVVIISVLKLNFLYMQYPKLIAIQSSRQRINAVDRSAKMPPYKSKTANGKTTARRPYIAVYHATITVHNKADIKMKFSKTGKRAIHNNGR